MLDAYRFLPERELQQLFPAEQIDTSSTDDLGSSDSETEKTELELLEDEVQEMCTDLQLYFYKKYGERWGSGRDGELIMRGFSKQEIGERTMLVPFKEGQKETESIFVGLSPSSSLSYSPLLVFHFVDAEGIGLDSDFNVELQDAYAGIVDPEYRKLIEILKDDEAFALTLSPAQEDISEASASRQMAAFLQEEFNIDAHSILTTLLKYFSEELVWEIKKSYLRQHYKELLTQFYNDLTALNQRIITEGFSKIMVQ